MDYESEEEDVGDDAEDKEDQVEEEEEEKVENSTLEEPLPESAETRVEKKKNKRAKRRGREGEESLSQMRVNSVLESNPAIEGYCYDHQHELWCEVSSCVSAQTHLRDCNYSQFSYQESFILLTTIIWDCGSTDINSSVL